MYHQSNISLMSKIIKHKYHKYKWTKTKITHLIKTEEAKIVEWFLREVWKFALSIKPFILPPLNLSPKERLYRFSKQFSDQEVPYRIPSRLKWRARWNWGVWGGKRRNYWRSHPWRVHAEQQTKIQNERTRWQSIN